jgi:predicted N-acetyltransferase YhbS
MKKKIKFTKEETNLAKKVMPLFHLTLKKSHQGNSKIVWKKQFEYLCSEIRKAKKNGLFECFIVGKKTRALILTYGEKDQFFGLKTRPWIFICKPDDKIAYQWIVRWMKAHQKLLSKDSNVFLPSSYGKIVPSLEKTGFSIDSIILDGQVKVALSRLMKKKNPSRDLQHLGLNIRKMKKSDISAILKINKEEFSKNPQFGWFVATPAFLKQHKKDLNRILKQKDHSHYIIEKGEKVLGHFGSDAKRGDAHGGLSLTFSGKIQGKGIAKTAYRILLEDLKRKKVKTFRGGTAQPAVMKLGKILDRKLAFILMRFTKGYFRKKHFSAYLDEIS